MTVQKHLKPQNKKGKQKHKTKKEKTNTRNAIKLKKINIFDSNCGLEEKHLDEIHKIMQNSPESSCGTSYK